MGHLHNFCEDAVRQGQPEEVEHVQICPTLESKLKKWTVLCQNHNVEVHFLQVNNSEPVLGVVRHLVEVRVVVSASSWLEGQVLVHPLPTGLSLSATEVKRRQLSLGRHLVN